MPTTVIETIAGVIKTRLELIRIANNYTVDATVYRPNRQKVSPQDKLLVFEYGDRTRTDEQSSNHVAGNPVAVTYDQNFRISGFRTSEDRSATVLDTLCDQFCADVEKAITNAASWWTFGGNAINAWIQSVRRGLSFESLDMFEIDLVVQYRVSETDPYTAR